MAKKPSKNSLYRCLAIFDKFSANNPTFFYILLNGFLLDRQ